MAAAAKPSGQAPVASPRCTVGIDLGTTHTVVAWAEPGASDVQLFQIEQLVAPGEVAARPLLPSLRYHPAPGELAAADRQLPWAAPADDDAVIGQLARRLGAQVPGRLVASAKSWLSHPGVDRLAPILPWGAPDEVTKVSPVAASASYLAHMRAAWDQRFPQRPLAEQDLVLTVPASFDDSARAFTLEAARLAGLPQLRLLEEPQAAFQHWLLQHRETLDAALGNARLVLVCDVGGGTTDLSLIQVERDGAGSVPRLRRIAVGQHLMLGGDNMDLALAHLAESRLSGAGGAAGGTRLSAAQLSQLVERCRAAKETLLANDAPERCSVTLLGSGSKLVGGARTAELGRDEVRALLLDGFLPLVAPDAAVQRRRSALVEFGLPYASDSAITRHLADFLRQHAAEARAALGWPALDAGHSGGPGDAAPLPVPDTLLLNGGVFRAELLAERLCQQLQRWRGPDAAPLRLLHNAHPDTAVACGAVAHVLARRGAGPQLTAGAPRSYFLRLDGGADPARTSSTTAPRTDLRSALQNVPPTRTAAAPRGLCVLPRGSEPGQALPLQGRRLALRLGQPVRFQLLSSTVTSAALGDVRELDIGRCQPLPPIATVLQAESTPGASPQHTRRELAVQLVSSYTELGTLELHALAEDGQRFKLEFELRNVPGQDASPSAAPAAAAPAGSGAAAMEAASAGTPTASATSTAVRNTAAPDAAALKDAIAQIDRVFGARSKDVTPKDVRQLRATLEQRLGRRERWELAVLRPLFDALWQRARGRRRSAEHERLWLNLAGWCLRPGFGAALDDWRVEQLWTLFAAGVAHGNDVQVRAQWWTLWRRVAAGLPVAAQELLLQEFGLNLQRLYGGASAGPAPLVPGGEDDMLRLGAALARIAVPHKVEVGAWLLQRLAELQGREAAGKANPPGLMGLLLWTLGRLGARQPLQGDAHACVPAEVAADWLRALLPLDWRRQPEAAFASAQIGRLTGDRARDIDEVLRQQLIERMTAAQAPVRWAALLREQLELDEAEQQQVFGEALPPGLRLLDA
ncbi:MAG: hypothetical protein RLY71_3876 [Pseudomonadota bacterium]|jgi:hypothetical protein